MNRHPPDVRFLRLALDLARRSPELGSSPVGAVLVGADGRVLATGRNRAREDWDPRGHHIGNSSFAHAEMDVFYQVGRLEDPANCTLYTSLEPCLMCGGAAGMVGLGRLVWASDDPWGGAGRLIAWDEHPAYRQTVVVPHPDPTLEREGVALFAPEARRAYPPEGWRAWRERYPDITRAVEEGTLRVPQETRGA